MESINSRLKKAMSMRNMKAIELAQKTDIDKGSISSYLSGRYKPKSKNIYKMANALEVEPAWLMGYDVPFDNKKQSNHFLKDVKFDKIDSLVKSDKNKELIKYLDIATIILFIYSNGFNSIFNKYYNELKDINENFSNIYNSLNKYNILTPTQKNKYDAVLSNLKELELIKSIKKYYSKEEILEEIDNRNLFKITDSKDEPVKDENERIKAIEYVINDILKDINSNQENKESDDKN